MALIGSGLASEVGLRVLLSPLGSNIVLRTACCFVGIGLPVYSTFKALENRDQNEQHKWLTYWAAYGSFSLVEVFTDKLISWFPLYYHVKFAFLVWLQLPPINRPKFIPKRFTSLRSIPAYENALKESFDRCLDLYLSPRVRKGRVRT